VLLALLCGPLNGGAALASDAVEVVSVTGQRIRLRDVLPHCPEPACDADLGPAPAAGSSRLVATSVLRSALTSAGADVSSVGSLRPVRVSSAARNLGSQELAAFVRPSIEQALPAGTRLVGVEAKSALVVPLLSTLGSCRLPALPKRAGPLTTTALVDFLHEGKLVRRVPVLVRLVMSERAALPDVPRGHVLSLIIARPGATISANGVALKATEIGQVGLFRVQRTGRVVQALIESAASAIVVEGS
jgi:hypothetical protein